MYTSPLLRACCVLRERRAASVDRAAAESAWSAPTTGPAGHAQNPEPRTQPDYTLALRPFHLRVLCDVLLAAPINHMYLPRVICPLPHSPTQPIYPSLARQPSCRHRCRFDFFFFDGSPYFLSFAAPTERGELLNICFCWIAHHPSRGHKALLLFPLSRSLALNIMFQTLSAVLLCRCPMLVSPSQSLIAASPFRAVISMKSVAQTN